MKKIVFLNGKYMPEDEAKVSIFDRGFLFADGIYEAVPVINGAMIDVEPFLERFDRSLGEVGMRWPMSKESYVSMLKGLIEKNDLKEGGVYTQVTRGSSFGRAFEFPDDLEPTCMAFIFEKKIVDAPQAKSGVKVVTTDDIRWKRRDIKSLMLLGQCMAKDHALKQGAYEGWMVEDGFVTEGTSSTAYIVKDGKVITRPLSSSILPGVRRRLLLELAPKYDIEIEQRAFTIEEAYEADEAFLSSATTIIYPIIEIDGKQIGSGKPGELSVKLRDIYLKEALKLQW